MAVSKVQHDRAQGLVSFRATAAGDVSPEFLLNCSGNTRLSVACEKQHAAGNCGVTVEGKPDRDLLKGWLTAGESLSVAFDCNGVTQRAGESKALGPGWYRVRVDTLQAAAGYVDVVVRAPNWQIEEVI